MGSGLGKYRKWLDREYLYRKQAHPVRRLQLNITAESALYRGSTLEKDTTGLLQSSFSLICT